MQLDSSDSGQGQVAEFYEQVNKPFVHSNISATFFWQSKPA